MIQETIKQLKTASIKDAGIKEVYWQGREDQFKVQQSECQARIEALIEEMKSLHSSSDAIATANRLEKWLLDWDFKASQKGGEG